MHVKVNYSLRVAAILAIRFRSVSSSPSGLILATASNLLSGNESNLPGNWKHKEAPYHALNLSLDVRLSAVKH